MGKAAVLFLRHLKIFSSFFFSHFASPSNSVRSYLVFFSFAGTSLSFCLPFTPKEMVRHEVPVLEDDLEKEKNLEEKYQAEE